MAYVTPKTDWDENYEPAPEDINRIEGNTKQNHDDILTEASNRSSADSALDSAKLNNTTDTLTGDLTITGGLTVGTAPMIGSEYGSDVTITTGSGGATVLFPRGFIIFKTQAISPAHVVQVFIDGGWNTMLKVDADERGIAFYSDGVNFRAFQSGSGTAISQYRILG